MSFQDYLGALRRGWLLIVVCVLLGVFISALATLLATPSYQATATVFVSSVGNGSPSDRQNGAQFAIARAESYANLVSTSVVLGPAAAEVGVSTDELNGIVTASARTDTNLIDIHAAASNPKLTAKAADAAAESLTTVVNELEDNSTTQATRVSVSMVQHAAAPTTAISPQPRTNAIVGLLGGAVVGIAITLIIQTLSTRLRGPRDVAGASGFVPLSIPEVPRRGLRAAAPERRRESYRSLRSNLRFGLGARGSIAIAGVRSDTDAREVAAELARAFGEIGARVLLVDADFRADVRRATGKQDEAGLGDALLGGAELADIALPGVSANTWQVGIGHLDEATAQSISGDRMTALLARAEDSYDYVLLVAPPLLERSEAAVIAALAGTSVLVIRSRVTRRGDLQFALERLAAVGVSSLSLVLDGVARGDMHPAVVTREAAMAAPRPGDLP